MLFRLLGGRKVTLVIAFAALVVANDVFNLGVTPGSLDRIGLGILGFVGVEGGRDIVETWGVTKPDHDPTGIDTTDDPYDNEVDLTAPPA